MAQHATPPSSSVSTVSAAARAQVLLLLGSNVEAEGQLERALRELARQFPLVWTSARCWSEAVPQGAPPYLNQAAIIECELPREALKPRLREIEAALGRIRPAPEPSLCPIDIDALARIEREWTIWDEKAWLAPYTAAVLSALPGFKPPS